MALELLGACYRTRKGIVSSNESEIRKFLEMSPSERAARLAAQELFNSLANGNEFVTVEQLQNRMREIYKMQKRKKSYASNVEISIKENLSDGEDFEEANQPSTSSSPLRVQSRLRHDDDDHISEANLLNAAHNYSNGAMPSLNQALTLSVPHPQSLENIPFLHRPFFHPSIFFALLYYRFIEILSSISFESLKKFQIFILLAIYALISSGSILTSLPTFVYYSTLTIMIIASCKMLKSKHQFIDFRIWSGLFLSYNDRVYADESEGLFLRKNLQPYVWFFFAFAVNLMVYPLIADQWLPHSEITVTGIILTFVTLLCFIRTSGRVIDFTVYLSFALNVFAKYPYDLDTMMTNKWRFMKLTESFVVGNGIELTMNYRGLLYVAISFLMLLLARRENWRGIYQFLFPHCVTLAWLQVAIISSQSATAFGLIRSTLGIAGIFFFLPIFGIATLIIPVFAAVEWLSVKDSTNRIFITISTSIIAIVASCFMAISRRTVRYVTYVQVLVCVLAICFLFRPQVISKLNEGGSIYSSSYLQQTSAVQSLDIIEDDSVMLTWEIYNKYCVTSDNSNRIGMQLRCSHLHGTNVHWEGTVSEVGISQIKNWRRDLFQNYFPDFLGNFLMCYFGDENQLSCFEGENCEIKEFIDSRKRCNVDKWNV